MHLPRSCEALAASLPDEPRWIETRSLLFSGNAQLSQVGDAVLVTDMVFPSGSLVGRADPMLLRKALSVFDNDFELVVQTDGLQAAQEALPGWTVRQVIVHSLTRPYTNPQPGDRGVVIAMPPEDRWLQGLPDDVRVYASLAEAIAVRVVEGVSVSICAASDVTETLWDVGIDTVERHRRHGHAAACFRSLAALMAAQGRQPVWSAFEDYPPSLTLAAKLGFRPVDRLAVLSPYVPAAT